MLLGQEVGLWRASGRSRGGRGTCPTWHSGCLGPQPPHPSFFLPDLHGGRQAGRVMPGWSHGQEEPRAACRAQGNQRLSRGRPRRARPGPRGPRLESEAPSGKSPACTPRKARPSAPRLCAEALPAPAQRSSAALGNTTGPAVGVEGGQGPSPSAWSLGVCAVGGPSVRGLAKWGGEESHWVIPSVHRVSGAGIRGLPGGFPSRPRHVPYD